MAATEVAVTTDVEVDHVAAVEVVEEETATEVVSTIVEARLHAVDQWGNTISFYLLLIHS